MSLRGGNDIKATKTSPPKQEQQANKTTNMQP